MAQLYLVMSTLNSPRSPYLWLCSPFYLQWIFSSTIFRESHVLSFFISFFLIQKETLLSFLSQPQKLQKSCFSQLVVHVLYILYWSAGWCGIPFTRCDYVSLPLFAAGCRLEVLKAHIHLMWFHVAWRVTHTTPKPGSINWNLTYQPFLQVVVETTQDGILLLHSRSNCFVIFSTSMPTESRDYLWTQSTYLEPQGVAMIRDCSGSLYHTEHPGRKQQNLFQFTWGCQTDGPNVTLYYSLGQTRE